MLKLKQKRHFTLSLPRFSFSKRMELGAVPITDDDELSQAIENDAVDRDNAWVLHERPDPEEFLRYWRSVEQDMSPDALDN